MTDRQEPAPWQLTPQVDGPQVACCVARCSTESHSSLHLNLLNAQYQRKQIYAHYGYSNAITHGHNYAEILFPNKKETPRAIKTLPQKTKFTCKKFLLTLTMKYLQIC